MENKSYVAAKLRALRIESGLTVRALAARAGMAPATYQNYEGRFKKTYLPLEIAEQIAKAFSGTNVKREEIMALAGASLPSPKAPTGDRLVPVYDVTASAGNGSLVPDYESIAYSLAFPPDYLSRITRSHPRNLSIISVKGESMEPTLKDDDLVMLDASKTSLSYDGMFVLRFDGTLHVKRVSRSPRKGYVTIISDNRAIYPEREWPVEEVDVIGKVIWFGRKV